MTPEEYFLNEKEKESDSLLSKFKSDEDSKQIFVEAKAEIKKKDQEIILFCGSAGSGKSTFWSNYLKDYVRVNNDDLGTY